MNQTLLPLISAGQTVMSALLGPGPLWLGGLTRETGQMNGDDRDRGFTVGFRRDHLSWDYWPTEKNIWGLRLQQFSQNPYNHSVHSHPVIPSFPLYLQNAEI